MPTPTTNFAGPVLLAHGLCRAELDAVARGRTVPARRRTIRVPGCDLGDEGPRPGAEAPGSAARPYAMVAPGVALLALDGPFWYTADLLCALWGGESTLRTTHALEAAADDDDVETLVLDIHSPGGHQFGSSDLMAAARRVAGAKRLVALCHDLCGSLAYWLASHAEEVVATPSALVGSIGSLLMLYDDSERFAAEGVRAVPITDAELKTAGQDGVPVTDEMVATMRAATLEGGALFRDAVAANRGLDAAAIEAWQGRIFNAREAVAAGLVDTVEETADFYARVLSGDAAPTPPTPPRPDSRGASPDPAPAVTPPTTNAAEAAASNRSATMADDEKKTGSLDAAKAALDELSEEDRKMLLAGYGSNEETKPEPEGETAPPANPDDPPANEADEEEQPGNRAKNPWQGPTRDVIAHAKARLGTVGVAEDRRGPMAYAALEAGVDSDTALFAFAVQQAHDPQAAQRAAAADASRGADAPLGGGRKGDGAGTGGGAVAAYRAAIDKRMQETKCSKQAATRYVNNTMPEVKAAYVEAVTSEAAQAGALRRA